MTFGGNNSAAVINMNGLAIPWVNKVRYLGVHFFFNTEKTALAQGRIQDLGVGEGSSHGLGNESPL